jgi:excisionase family DNA binding protein
MAEWVGLEEAARRLGVSGQTVRRWIKAGKIPFQKERKGKGYAYLVNIQALKPGTRLKKRVNNQGTGDHPASPSPQEAWALVMAEKDKVMAEKDRVIARLQLEVETLKGELSEKNRQMGELLFLLRQAQEQVKALPPPKEKKRRFWWPFG